jgi:ankyrin repeat protein
MSPTYPLHEQVLQADLAGVIALIGQDGVHLNELDSLGHAPLHWAVFGGYYDIVQVLLEAGADPNTLSADGVTPKWNAVDFGLDAIVDLLTLYGGKVQTDERFNRAAFTVFLGAIGQALPPEEA